jgi:hypothetical protein
MPSQATNEATTREWRELGFFYERDDENRIWRLIASRSGLVQFCDALRLYAAEPSNGFDSEHKHYGPYSYLKVMTWPSAGIDRHSIHGSLSDLVRLATLIESKLSTSRPDSTIIIRDEFASNSAYALGLVLREDGFDPASADPLLATSSSSTH